MQTKSARKTSKPIPHLHENHDVGCHLKKKHTETLIIYTELWWAMKGKSRSIFTPPRYPLEMFFSLILKISKCVAPVSGVGWMSVTESLMYRKLFTCPCEHGHKPSERPLCSKECLQENGNCFPISGSEVRKVAVLCSTDIKENLWLWRSLIFWLYIMW